ncbi:Peptidase S28 [Penicillium malachiteum]|uniref:Peptidase S28 n=1 Tax=Penicillium malachiteum TaxID=1324776 RepID=UPI002547C413|nr:Peptidase S28 [Penicillium malachiteum]KAJ5730002.1 Peptidase S28 [Penicillium malachiteum]
MYMLSSIALSLLAAPSVLAVGPKIPAPPATGSSSKDSIQASTFEQLLDHSDPSLGTFSQRYWWNSEWWAGEGSPVVLFTPGEVAADEYTGYLDNETITGLYAQEINGAVILLEHRYWGESSPYDVLNTENLRYLTLENAVQDLVYFAKNVDLEFDTDSSSNAQNAPWVLSGGSYSGALTAWTESVSPGTFWAYHASSAPVEAIYDYWQYFKPIQEGMAKNCSADVSRVVDYVDEIANSGTKEEQQTLKELFGLGDLEHFDDFAAALENGPWLWQENAFYTGYSEFFEFCDYVENVDAGASVVPGADGVGLKKALQGYAKWFTTVYFPGSCASYGYWSDENSTACYDTYNASSPIFTDMSVDNEIDRQWQWLLCNEPFFYWQDGAPSDVQTIVSRSVDAEYWQRQCPLYFPTVNGYTYASAKGKTAADVNSWTKGWDLTDTTRLTWTNGQYDPWRESGVSSDYRPGGPLASRASAPVNIIPGGFHCSDLLLDNAAVNSGVQKVVEIEVAQIKAWVAEYYK